MKIVIPDQIDLSEEIIEKIRNLEGGVHLTTYSDIPKETSEIISRIKDAEIITANWIDITKEIINNSPKLKYIIVPAVGYEWVDIETANEKGIKVVNCPTYNSHAVAEHTIALMFTVVRRIVEANTDLKKGYWQPGKFKGEELVGKTLSIIGYGNIGKQVAKLAENLGMKVLYANSKSSESEIDYLISECDILSLNLPLTEKTKHLIDKRRLDLLKKGSYIINTARGAIIEQTALIEVLKSGQIAGAGLDVFENEPLKGKPTEEILQLVNLENVVATPHIGFNTSEAFERLGEEILQNAKACLKRQPINVVN